jgi:hypothetical protein
MQKAAVRAVVLNKPPRKGEVAADSDRCCAMHISKLRAESSRSLRFA